MTPKRFLITGGAGFVGSHLTESFIKTGHQVTVIDDLSTGRWENIGHLEGNPAFHAIVASADDRALIEREMPRHDFVYHLASAVGVQLVIDRPVETVQRIVRTTDVLVEAAARYRKPILLTSTSEVYGKSESIPFREDDDVVMGATCKRRWAYASAKMLDEFLLLAQYYQSSLPVYIVRLFNTVGPRQSGQYGMVLPRFVSAALAGKPLEVFGDGNQQRCFCSVFDIVSALAALNKTPQAIGKVINLGSNEEISMIDLAKRVVRICKSSSAIINVPYDKAYGPGFDDMRRRVPDISRAQEILGWTPTTSLDDIIRLIASN